MKQLYCDQPVFQNCSKFHFNKKVLVATLNNIVNKKCVVGFVVLFSCHFSYSNSQFVSSLTEDNVIVIVNADNKDKEKEDGGYKEEQV